MPWIIFFYFFFPPALLSEEERAEDRMYVNNMKRLYKACLDEGK